MAEESGQEKTEKATSRKRSKAREEGQVAKSQEIASVLVLLVGMSVLYVFGYLFYPQALKLLEQHLSFEPISSFGKEDFLAMLKHNTVSFFLLLLPVMGAVFVTAFAANLFQVGFQVSTKAITPKLSKVDVIKGFGRLFSLKSLMESLKSMVKLTVIGTVVYFAIKGEMGALIKLHNATVAYIFLYILQGIFKIFIWVLLIMIIVAILDYSYQKWQFEKDLKMTKQEVKEEHKETEGDPQVKSRIRSIQLQAARKRMMQQVPKADVVVTNPTHLAVAIKYDPLAMAAPTVIAKGAGLIAERIKTIASEHHIPVMENKELARNLYRLLDVGEQIPSEFFRAVAELLAYVYKLKGKTVR
ncbi:MAG: flagellar biosynthesis protein FlhB [Desulfobacterales bacterium]|jgi:flagellar biosynthetic protein FlhB|nr:flagellar biosynthesis protein FlhB [Desulfobacterales bacterium]